MDDLDLEAIKAMLACLTPYDEQYRLGAIYCAAPTTIAALVAEVEANRAEIARLRTLLPSAEELDTAIDACAEARERVCWDPTRFDVATAWLSRVAEEVDRV